MNKIRIPNFGQQATMSKLIECNIITIQIPNKAAKIEITVK